MLFELYVNKSDQFIEEFECSSMTELYEYVDFLEAQMGWEIRYERRDSEV